MKLSLGFSPCPNDTYIFDALVNHKIETKGYEFDIHISDVEELNHKVLNNELDVSKISFATYPQIHTNYKIVNSGSALGINNGPLIISRTKVYPDELHEVKIAIPGIHTTANLLLTIAFPKAKNKKEYLFSDIEEAILSNEVDAGVIIHETRFTYKKKGLTKITDLGEWWHSNMHLPLPLGGIVIEKKHSQETQNAINALIKDSLMYAMENPQSAEGFIKQHSKELSDEVIKQHIELYVNDYSIDMGKEGRNAIETLFREGVKADCFCMPENDIFV